MNHSTHFKFFPGSALRRFVWTESLKVTPPSPSIRKELAAISTVSRSTKKREFPWVSETRNVFACTSSLSCPRNNWFSSNPSTSLVLNVMFLDDSVERNIIIRSFHCLFVWNKPNVMGCPTRLLMDEVLNSSRIIACPSSCTPPSTTFSWPIPS